MENEKLKMLIVASDNVGGVGFYRSSQPHEYIEKTWGEEFEIVYNMHPDWENLSELETYDIIYVHKGITPKLKEMYNALAYLKDKKTVTVMDIDDYWDLSPTHPQYLMQKQYHLEEIVIQNLRLFDYVTTTTEYFAERIRKYNQNVFVFPNAIDPTDTRFQITKPTSKYVRVGLIMGSAHEYDIKLIDRFVKKMSTEARDKMQIVLCGFDTRGTMRTVDSKTNKVYTRPIKAKETVWYRYEQMMTDNYATVSPKHRRFLNLFVPQLHYPTPEEEHYRRCWTKDMNHYYKHFENVDVLLAPLEPKDFNYVKSELKAIECCFSNTALIASNYGPYALTLNNAIGDDGNFNGVGNAILIDENKNDTDWAKYIEMLIMDEEKLKTLQNNIHESFKDKYDLKTVCSNRRDFYKKITNK